jgi:hypothetical protein
MMTILSESIVAGILTFVIGTIIFNLSINKKNKREKKPISINFAFFMTGFVLHIFLNLSGFDKWYCDKQCRINQIQSQYPR